MFDRVAAKLATPLSPMIAKQTKIILHAERFSHQDALRIYREALLRARRARTVIIDLGRAKEATTSAFARLVLLRRALRQAGCDLLIIGLRGKAALLYEVNRLASVLPCDASGSSDCLFPAM
jgi:anti-anti-sigma regulatory factor